MQLKAHCKLTTPNFLCFLLCSYVSVQTEARQLRIKTCIPHLVYFIRRFVLSSVFGSIQYHGSRFVFNCFNLLKITLGASLFFLLCRFTPFPPQFSGSMGTTERCTPTHHPHISFHVPSLCSFLCKLTWPISLITG